MLCGVGWTDKESPATPSNSSCRQGQSEATENGAFLSVYVEHTGDFPRGVGHRVENGRGLTKVAVVLLNGLIW